MHSKYTYNLGLAFEERADRFSEKAALRFPASSLMTYAELNSAANRIARWLLSQGLKRGDVVALFNRKSKTALATMLACLKTGVIYTNLDITSPWERIRKILETCRPSLVFNDHGEETMIDEVATAGHRIQDISETAFVSEVSREPESNLQLTDEIHGGDAAYIMFTSGSTGFPKGATMSHANVLNFIEWAQSTLDVTSDDVLTNINPIYFDNSVFDFYTALFSGATLCPISKEIVSDGRQLVECVSRLKCTIWFSVPSLLVYLLTTRVLTRDDLGSIRQFVFGGEGFPKPKLKELYDLYGHRSRLINVYGPTECTCICSAYSISGSDFANLNDLAPLGKIAPNFGCEILRLEGDDPDFGELCLTGPNVGLGYYNDSERTQLSFIQNPFKRNYREIMYKTGDLVRRKNGLLHFKGRVDNQIKHLGYRIELEEIEAAFNSLSYVKEAGVVYHRLGDGMGQIVAFLSTSNGITEKEILAEVKKLVPPYMVPRQVQFLPVLPKNQNGKIDRVQLGESFRQQ